MVKKIIGPRLLSRNGQSLFLRVRQDFLLTLSAHRPEQIPQATNPNEHIHTRSCNNRHRRDRGGQHMDHYQDRA